MSKLTKVTLLLMVWLLSSAVVFAQSALPARDLARMAEQGIVYAPNETTPTPHGFNGNITDATWDVLFQFNTAAAASPGVETDGTYIYASNWQTAGSFSKYTNTGVFVENFTVAGAGACRDLAFDGTYFYGGAAAGTIYKMDFTNKVLVGTIPTGAVAVRHIGYDPTANANAGGFWAGNWSTLALVSMTGTTITNVTGLTLAGMYGNAYDPWTTGGPYLWLFDQGDGAGTPQLVHQFKIATLAVTGVNHNVSDIPGYSAADAIAGGLATSDDLVSGKFVMLANIQQTNNLIGVYELALTANTSAPGPVTNLMITPGANGALNAALAWTNPSVNVGGGALTQLTAVKIYRNDVLIQTVNNPPIGGNSTYTDNGVPAAGMYTYKLVPENSFGAGTPVVMDKWIGPDVPAAVTNLMLTAQGEDGLLTWTNPTAGLHGGYYTGLTGYNIVRMPDNATFNVAGPVTQWVDNTVPGAGTYYYTVTTKNAAGTGGTATSNPALLNSGNILLFEEFTGGTIPAGWSVVGPSGLTNWSVVATANAGGTAPELRFGWSPSFVGLSAIMTGVINTEGQSELQLEFKHFVDWYSTTFTCGVATTIDGGATWEPVWTINPTGNVGPETVTVTINNAHVGNPNFQLGIFYDGDSFEIDYWYIDNVMLSGSGGGPVLTPPTNLAGVVNGNDVTLTWDYEGGASEWLKWDDGANYTGLGLGAPGQFECAVRFTDLAAYDGWSLSKVAFFPRADFASTFTLKVYSGANASTLLLTQPLNGLTQYTWNEITLSSPVQVAAGTELWVSIAVDNADGDYPMGIDNGPAVVGFGDMITLDGVTWESMATAYGIDNNHNLQAYVEEPVEGLQYALPIANNTQYQNNASLAIAPIKPVVNGIFNPAATRGLQGFTVQRDGNDITGVITPQTYTDMDLANGTYVYTVKAVYDEGTSAASNPYTAVINVAAGPQIVVNPTSVTKNVVPGGTATSTLTITNTGDQPLDYNIAIDFGSDNGAVAGKPVSVEHTGLTPRELEKMNQSAVNAGGLLKAAGKASSNQAPLTDDEVIRYDDGVNFDAIGLTSGGTFEVAAYWPASTMGQYTGMALSKLDVYINDGVTSILVKVYGAGSAGAPGALLYSQTFTVTNVAWNTLTLGTQVPITGEDIWIGYEVTHTGGTYPAGCDDGPAIAGFGDMIYFSGTWAPLSGYGLNYNWNIAATLVAGGPAPTNDVGVFAVLSPNTGPNLGNEVVTIQVKNYGTASQSNIPVSYTINGGAPVNGVVPGPVASNATVDYTFPGTANLSGVATYEFNACTNLTGDENASNNCKTKSVTNMGDVLLNIDFSNGTVPAGWSVYGLGQTNWTISSTANAGGATPELRFSWSPAFVGDSYLSSPPLNTTGMTELSLSFKHFVDWYSTTFTVGVATSADGGTTWTPAWSVSPTGNVGPETIETTITQNVGSANFQIALFFSGDSFEIDYWYIDNIVLSGSGTPPQPDWLTVTPLSGTVNPGQSASVSLLFDATDYIAGQTENANLVISNNSPNTPVNVPVTMNVMTMGPEIEVNPSSVVKNVVPGGTATANLAITNNGGEDLTYSLDINLLTDQGPSKYGVEPSLPDYASLSARDLEKIGQTIKASGKANNSVGPVTDDEVIRYDDGTNFDAIGLTSGGTFEVAAYWPAAEMGQYAGMELSKLDIYINDGVTSVLVKVYGPGSAGAPGSLLYSETFAVSNVAWNTLELTTPVPITGDDIWFGYEVTHTGGTYPAGCDAGPAVAGFGDMIYFSGTWAPLSGYGLNYNWNIAGTLTAGGPAPTNDVGVFAILSPNTGPNLGNEIVKIQVKNYGTASQTNIPVSYTINGGAPVNGVVPGPVASNATVDYTFPGTANLSGVTTYAFNACTNLAGDENANNNCKTKSVTNMGNVLISEDFSSGQIPAGWQVIGSGATNWSVAASANAGGVSPELRFSWSPSFVGDSYLASPALNTAGMTELGLSLKHFVDWYSTTFTVGVATSGDGGATWTPVWSINPTGNVGPETIETTITANVGSSNFHLAVFFSGDSFEIDYWYIDDLVLSGGGTAPMNWLAAVPSQGSVPAGQSSVVDLQFNAAGLANGEYMANLNISSNDPSTPMVVVPVTMCVGCEGLYVTPGSFNVEVETGQTLNSSMTISNFYAGDVTVDLSVMYGTQKANALKPVNAPVAELSPRDIERMIANGIVHDGTPTPKAFTGSTSEDTWDVLFSFQATAAANPGIETDGMYIYTSNWQTAGTFGKYTMDGTFIETFTIPGAGACRDLAFDGTYFYGGAAANTIYKLDFTNKVLVGTISSAVAVRHIGFDPTANGGNGGFWCGNWSDLSLITMTGAILNQASLTLAGMYGNTFDPWTSGGPYLWIFDQGGGAGTPQYLHQFNIASLSLTGVTHDVSDLPGYNAAEAIAGGLAGSEDLVAGKFVLICNVQQTNNLIGGYELAVTAPPSAPGPATNVAVAPGANGALTATITWTNPSVNVGGTALTELTAMKVYRDDALIYTLNNPPIGGNSNYTDNAVGTAGMHIYKLVGVNSAGDGTPATGQAWIGPDVPAAVTSLTLTAQGDNGLLTWVNPTAGLHGGYYTGVTGYDIKRYPDMATFNVAGPVTQWIDNTVPAAGNYYYDVTTKNAAGLGGTATSNVALLQSGGLLIFEDFQGGAIPAGWSVVGMGQTNWSVAATANAGGVAPELRFSWSPSFVGLSALMTNVVNTTGMDELQLSFTHFVDWYSTTFTCGVATTVDGGATWNPVWTISPTGNVGPETVNVTINDANVGSANFQLGIFFDGDSFEIDYWYIDDVMLSGAGGPGPGWLVLNPTSGTVPAGGSFDVGVTFDATDLEPGTYTANIMIDNSSPTTPVLVPVTLTVTGGGCALPPPTNLEMYIGPVNKINFTWEAPSLGEWIRWDDGTNFDAIGLTSGGTFSVAARWTAAQIAPYAGQYLTKVAYFPNDGASTYILKVWKGANAATPLLSQPITNVVPAQWNEVMLSTPVMIDGAQEFWVGYEVTHAAGAYPAGCDDGPAIAGFGDKIYFSGAWGDLSGYGLNYNWNIAGYIGIADNGKPHAQPIMIGNVPPATTGGTLAMGNLPQSPYAVFNPGERSLNGYNLYGKKDNGNYTKLNSTLITNTMYQWTLTQTGTWSFYVTADYTECESNPSNIVTDLLGVGVNELSVSNLNIFPNPATDLVNVQADNMISRIKVVSYSGKVMFDELINSESAQINTSALAPGVYFIQVETGAAVETRKLVIR